MSDLIYAALEAAEVSGERPTLHLRWNNGVLEQKWEREIYSPKPSITHDWRPVPAINEAPPPAQKPLVSAPANPSGNEQDMPKRIWAGDFDRHGFGHCVAGMQGGLYEEYVHADQQSAVEQERDRWIEAAQTTSQSLTAAKAQLSALQARIQGLEEALKLAKGSP
jgi:hypothetical protein